MACLLVYDPGGGIFDVSRVWAEEPEPEERLYLPVVPDDWDDEAEGVWTKANANLE